MYFTLFRIADELHKFAGSEFWENSGAEVKHFFF
jgi:hypothetical protein